MYGLIHKYFPEMTAGREFREITDKELKRTFVYAIQIDEWPALDEKWFSKE